MFHQKLNIMKINKTNVARLLESVESETELFRKKLEKYIITLCKEINDDPNEPIVFTHTFILPNTRTHYYKKSFHGYNTSTILCNKLLWSNLSSLFMVQMNDDIGVSSRNLTIDNLHSILKELLMTIKKLSHERN